MQRVMALFVSAYWAAFFGLMALTSVGEATEGGPALSHVLRIPGMRAELGIGPAQSTVLALGFGLASALFAWAALTAVTCGGATRTDADDAARAAFGVSVGLMTALLLLGALHPSDGLFAAASLQVLALLVSYIAIHTDRRRQAVPAEPEAGAAARLMALGAAHTSLLSRLPGRAHSDIEKGS